MYLVPLKNTPNQELSVTINGVFYTIRLRYWSPDNKEGIMFASVKVGDNDWTGATRCVPNQALIPYQYLSEQGNFYFICSDKQYPDYKKFGVEHRLAFLDNNEIAEIQNV